MKQLLQLMAGAGILLGAATLTYSQVPPQARSTEVRSHALDHGEVGVYGDLFRVAPSGAPAVNYLGLGARVGFNVATHTALEGEMSYDFEQNYTRFSTNGTGSTVTYTAEVRPITGLFGPKFQFGSSGPFRAFAEGKVGFIDFSTGCHASAGSPTCFTNSLAAFGGNSTHVAVYPGGGIEFFAGPLGLRVEAGDEIWFNNGTYNNLRVTFSPTLRF